MYISTEKVRKMYMQPISEILKIYLQLYGKRSVVEFYILVGGKATMNKLVFGEN